MEDSVSTTRLEAGIDEAGRGSFFGSVFAAACIMPPDPDACNPRIVKDSKKFSTRIARERAAEHVKHFAIDWSVAHATAEEVDEMNIGQATTLAMHRAISGLVVRPDHLMVDGSHFKPYVVMTGDDDYESITHTTLVKGDSKHFAIAAASILAKVAHDTHINDLCKTDPTLDTKYGLTRNMGYGTTEHRAGIVEHGTHDLHRTSFQLIGNRGAEAL
jgi:ribonuclease HII